MSSPLRFTFEEKDYTYKVLTSGINTDTTEIKISLSGEEFTLLKDLHNQCYAAENSIGDQTGPLKAITRAVVLRYRL